VAPDVLDALQDANGRKLTGLVVALCMQTLDEGRYGGELATLARTMERKKMIRECASMGVKHILAVVGAGLRKRRRE
jgi:hypothetical protein